MRTIGLMIAGIHDGILYDLSVDATGKSLADCGL
jgi:hypothetical protein